MTKLVDDSALDALLATAGAATELYLCSGDPTTRAQAITNSLTDTGTPESPPTTTGPQNGTPNGRELVYNALAGLTITAAGTAATVCLCDATTLLLKTDLSSTVVVGVDDTVDLGAFTHTVGDAA